MAPEVFAGHATANERKRAEEAPDFAAQARGQLPPEPQAPAPVEQLDTKAADAALATVDAAGRARLSDQAFPPMAPMPGGHGAAGAGTRSLPPAAEPRP